MTIKNYAAIGAVIAAAAKLNEKAEQSGKYWFFVTLEGDGKFRARLHDRATDEDIRTYELNIVKDTDNALKMINSLGWVEGYADGIEKGEENKQAEIDALKREVEELRLAAKVLTSGNGEADNKPEVEF